MPDHARADPQTAPLTIAKLQDPVKRGLEQAQKDIKPIYSGLNKYGKALDKVRRARTPDQHPETHDGNRSSKTSLYRPHPMMPFLHTRSL